jgi:hypothetical protein
LPQIFGVKGTKSDLSPRKFAFSRYGPQKSTKEAKEGREGKESNLNQKEEGNCAEI